MALWKWLVCKWVSPNKYSAPIVSVVQCGLVLINGHCHHRTISPASPPILKKRGKLAKKRDTSRPDKGAYVTNYLAIWEHTLPGADWSQSGVLNYDWPPGVSRLNANEQQMTGLLGDSKKYQQKKMKQNSSFTYLLRELLHLLHFEHGLPGEKRP